MFWSGNYIGVRELNFLLKEENVTLSQVLEADDILQECKADNKTLIAFLTKPEILSELITLITEEPPKNVELASQYRHASIACEVLTSQLSGLSDRLSLDTALMNRLCDFINNEPPLNPLLASYFSKTVEMLLERSPKQDWYLYHIVCLRVLDFFKSRRDFLPNLLRHLHTSAIADTFKYFIRLDDLFNKIVMEWLDEHQFLECLIQIICGTYIPEPIRPASEVAACPPSAGPTPNDSRELTEKADSESTEKSKVNQAHKQEFQDVISIIKNITFQPSSNGQGSGEHISPVNQTLSQPLNHKDDSTENIEGVTENKQGITETKVGVTENKQEITGNKEEVNENKQEITENKQSVNENAHVVIENKQEVNENQQEVNENIQGVTENKLEITENKQVYNENKQGVNDNKQGVTENKQGVTEHKEGMKDVEEERLVVDEERVERMKAVAAANAAALLCDLILSGCSPDGSTTRARTVWAVVWRLQSERWVRALLAAVFTSPQRARHTAIVHACQILLALLSTDPILGGGCAAERTSVELAVAPHLPLLHQALLQAPDQDSHSEKGKPTANDKEPQNDAVSSKAERVGAARVHVSALLAHLALSEVEDVPTTMITLGTSRVSSKAERVGAARVHVSALLAHLALSEVEDVPTTMITLGTPGVLLDLFFAHPHNNFLHAAVYALIKHALANQAYRHHYAHHLLVECDLLTRLMDAFEENENKGRGSPRAGYMGHVILALRRVCRALEEQEGQLRHQLRLPETLLARWDSFRDDKLKPVSTQHDTPLGGYYPSDNIYEAEHMADLAEGMEASYEFNDMAGGTLDEMAEDMNMDSGNEEQMGGEGGADKVSMVGAQSAFLELASQRFDDDMWEDGPDADPALEGPPAPRHDVADVLAAVAPWETASSDSGNGGPDEDWAQFSAAAAPPPLDPYAPVLGTGSEFTAFWPGDTSTTDASANNLGGIEEGIQNLQLFSASFDPSSPAGVVTSSSAEDKILANNLLSAMSGMTPDLIAKFVDANFPENTLEPTDIVNINDKSVDSQINSKNSVTDFPIVGNSSLSHTVKDEFSPLSNPINLNTQDLTQDIGTDKNDITSKSIELSTESSPINVNDTAVIGSETTSAVNISSSAGSTNNTTDSTTDGTTDSANNDS